MARRCSPGSRVSPKFLRSLDGLSIETDCCDGGTKQGVGKCSQSDQGILDYLDIGGCTNADGTMAQAKDLHIDPCELKNATWQFGPDVQIYDASGNYPPSSQNAMKDSLSIGLGFTAVPASD